MQTKIKKFVSSNRVVIHDNLSFLAKRELIYIETINAAAIRHHGWQTHIRDWKSFNHCHMLGVNSNIIHLFLWHY